MVQFNGGEHMSVTQYRSLCHQNRGRAVRIRTRDGIIHRGVIDHVDHHSVFIRPNPRNQRLGGFASGFFGGYGGFGGYGRGVGPYRIALGTIIAIALIPLVFW